MRVKLVLNQSSSLATRLWGLTVSGAAGSSTEPLPTWLKARDLCPKQAFNWDGGGSVQRSVAQAP